MRSANSRGGRSSRRRGSSARFEVSPWQGRRPVGRQGSSPARARSRRNAGPEDEKFLALLRKAAETPTDLKRCVEPDPDRTDPRRHAADHAPPRGTPGELTGRPERGRGRGRGPWAKNEPLFGEQGRKHALSGRPGTPPCGNLAVQVPAGFVLAYRGSSAEAAEADRKALAPLAETVRVEIEIDRGRRWTCGFALLASSRGLEVTLGGCSADARDLLQVGRRVDLFVTPRVGSVCEIAARIIRVDPPRSPDGGPVRVQILVDASDAKALGQWERVVDRARKR